MPLASVLTRQVDATLVVTLNRPEVHNAIDADLADGVDAAFNIADGDPAIRAIVVHGAGRSFCAGVDLRAYANRAPGSSQIALEKLVRTWRQTPVIAAVEGHAVGGGFEFALACDSIVAADDALLGIPEVRRSLVPTGGALLRLRAQLPRALVTDMALTGTPVRADRLYTAGLIARLTAPGDALNGALTLAAEIAASGPAAVAASRALLHDIDPVSDAQWAQQSCAAEPVNRGSEAAEGIRSFLDGRAPRWMIVPPRTDA